MNIKTNSVVSSNGNETVNLPNGFTSGTLTINGNISVNGISTYHTLDCDGVISSTINVTSISGSGSQISNTPTIQSGRVIALKYIFSDPPLRA